MPAMLFEGRDQRDAGDGRFLHSAAREIASSSLMLPGASARFAVDTKR